MVTTIAIMGAGGYMGLQSARQLKDNPDYRALHVEVSDEGRKRLSEMGLSTTSQGEALSQADVVLLAVPDRLIASIARDIVPAVRSGAMIMGLDPAAAHAGVLPRRDDISYFVTHPCHPPMFGDETEPEAQQDFVGSDKAKQAVVCALHQGPEADYARGEAIARVILAPVLRVHRVTTEQMATLEPALAETIAYTFVYAMKEAMDEAVRRGIPEPVARDFLLGHLRCGVGEVFLWDGSTISEGCKRAVAEAQKQMFQPDWMKVMRPESIKESVRNIVQA